jgi:hypothetical protein
LVPLIPVAQKLRDHENSKAFSVISTSSGAEGSLARALMWSEATNRALRLFDEKKPVARRTNNQLISIS